MVVFILVISYSKEIAHLLFVEARFMWTKNINQPFRILTRENARGQNVDRIT